jgi:hypothetical protein
MIASFARPSTATFIALPLESATLSALLRCRTQCTASFSALRHHPHRHTAICALPPCHTLRTATLPHAPCRTSLPHLPPCHTLPSADCHTLRTATLPHSAHSHMRHVILPHPDTLSALPPCHTLHTPTCALPHPAICGLPPCHPVRTVTLPHSSNCHPATLFALPHAPCHTLPSATLPHPAICHPLPPCHTLRTPTCALPPCHTLPHAPCHPATLCALSPCHTLPSATLPHSAHSHMHPATLPHPAICGLPPCHPVRTVTLPHPAICHPATPCHMRPATRCHLPPTATLLICAPCHPRSADAWLLGQLQRVLGAAPGTALAHEAIALLDELGPLAGAAVPALRRVATGGCVAGTALGMLWGCFGEAL